MPKQETTGMFRPLVIRVDESVNPPLFAIYIGDDALLDELDELLDGGVKAVFEQMLSTGFDLGGMCNISTVQALAVKQWMAENCSHIRHA